jgi:DNA polymerase III subunit alpha
LTRFPGKTPVVLFLDTWEDAKSNGNGHHRGDDPLKETARTPLRCIVSTPLAVTCSADLRRELVESLGAEGFRFVSTATE